MGRELVSPLGNVSCEAEQVLELVSGDKELLRRQVHQGIQRHESGSRLAAPDALGRVDEPAEPWEDAEHWQHLTHGQGLPSSSFGENQIV